jgi:hypothetical protein
LRSNNGLSAISPVRPGPLLETTLEDRKRALSAKKGKPGQTDRAPYAFAAQYMQKPPKNNVFFGPWLIEFSPGVSGA